MPTKSYLSFTGFILLIIATYCPLLKPFGIFPSMDLYALNEPFGITIMLVGIIGILGVTLRQRAMVKLCAWISLLLIVVLYLGVIFKIHNFFSIVPFKSVAHFLTRQIRFKWGWFVLFAGPVLAIIGIVTTKSGAVAQTQEIK